MLLTGIGLFALAALLYAGYRALPLCAICARRRASRQFSGKPLCSRCGDRFLDTLKELVAEDKTDWEVLRWMVDQRRDKEAELLEEMLHARYQQIARGDRRS